MPRDSVDFLVAGAGIVGLSIARELRRRHPGCSVMVAERAAETGMHGSGRNSGVLHSGVYYPHESLKARFCAQGAAELAAFCASRGVEVQRRGKLIVATRSEEAGLLDTLQGRATANGIEARLIGPDELRRLEPMVRSATGTALWVPSTSVADPAKVIAAVTAAAEEEGVRLSRLDGLIGARPERGVARLARSGDVGFGHLVNAAGLHADRVARLFAAGSGYRMLPFKGLYWKLDPASGIQVRHLVYPVPDLRVPFLGVHTTPSVSGGTYLGPTAIPVLGRENYRGLRGIRPVEAARILRDLAVQFWLDHDGFRALARREAPRLLRTRFADAARAILPSLEDRHLLPCGKVGIRPQLLRLSDRRLVTDFVVERGTRSTHVLNAISPAWTSALPFAGYICDAFVERP